MKICFLVFAHHQPIILRRLLRNIAWNNADVVIHIDRRTDIRIFGAIARSNIHVMPKRRRIYWAGWSQIFGTIDGLEYALKVSDADYFTFLAGTDFPLRNRAAISSFLQEKWPANFLNYYPLVPGIWGYGLIKTYRRNDLKGRFVNPRTPLDDPALAAWRRIGARAVTGLEGFLNSHFGPRDSSFIKLYHGSSRWCLNRQTVEYVVSYFRSPESRMLRRFLKTCANADEIFIQTTVLNSPFRDQCIEFDQMEADEIFARSRPPLPDEKRVYMHYIDWSTERENPAIVVDHDFPALKESGKFFACKFLDDRSLPLIDRIERELIGDEEN